MTSTLRSPASGATPAPAPTTPAPRVRPGAVGLFVALAYGLGWLVALPLWLGDGLREPFVPLISTAMMTTPTIAALVVVLLVMRTRHPARFLGLVVRRPLRTAAYALVGAIGAPLLVLCALLIGTAAGVTSITVAPGLLSTLLMLPVLTAVIGVAAIGEEIGWRGFLQTALRPLGTWPALLITGAVWGLWHAPLVLLGYNYGTTDPLALVAMTFATVPLGVLVGWLRMRTGSIWAGALTHGAINAATSLALVALVAPADQDPATTLLGWTGALLIAAVVAVLVAARVLRWTEPVQDVAREAVAIGR